MHYGATAPFEAIIEDDLVLARLLHGEGEGALALISGPGQHAVRLTAGETFLIRARHEKYAHAGITLGNSEGADHPCAAVIHMQIQRAQPRWIDVHILVQQHGDSRCGGEQEQRRQQAQHDEREARPRPESAREATMIIMDDSMAQAHDSAGPLPRAHHFPGWKDTAGWICAVGIAVIMLVAGVWKISNPLATAQRMTQALIPANLSLAAALSFGIAETFAGLLILVPRWRRWGAWLSTLLLLAFMIYIGWNYHRLLGEDCSCFPWLKRSVGPGFFISDGIMLLMAVLAGVWSRPPESLRNAVIALGAIAVFAGATYGVTAARQTGLKAPESITVAGQPVSLQQGKAFVFFFDPQCMHCDAAARVMAKHAWNSDVKLYALPTTEARWGEAFLKETSFAATLSLDTKPMRDVFKFTDPPYAVALENGRQVQAFSTFDDKEPESSLRRLGFIR
jgi:uncharacterized membrane protein YphA (DoxX/SURF4 family)